ncbi:sigma-54-dependent Fis family transcriptional regulator [Archangium lansingense]|uniref:Sigma-54-dependent Fis family transcriptional regulator n=2 Tax=Archangium lansingense TaxID=2995310 RepID=A0ABT4ACI0_9BACT|nr:sigma-54-dependent Fis family transcriptional regulator [Archangium lansinium]MCY1079286.1 sigma-54-dependent Fis family transcriptional regulator [Archangium lansinium]
MRLDDLDLRELLQFEPAGGILRFAGQRAVLLDAVALGLLRKQLIETLGHAGARALLTRFGYALGRRTAETLKDAFPWDSEDDWRRAGGRFHRLQGLVLFEPVRHEQPVANAPFAEALWHESFEAEQHLLHLGLSEEPVCWTLCGFASGYLSYGHGRPIYCLEAQCRGKGDATCVMVGRPQEEWGEEAASQLGYYEKDCLDEALTRVTQALKSTERTLKARKRELARTEGEDDSKHILGKSPAMQRVQDLAVRVAKVDSTILITGESGVGKEVLARFIHEQSARAGGPFVALNCGAVPESLLESELFGHARGAFTGATQDRIGLFESAQGGTLFLDELGEVPLSMQVKILRALQEREIRRVGENKNRPVEVRVVAATNRDLAADIQTGRFRQDLYYRLRVVEIRIPPLRERRDDILALARLFLVRSASRLRRKVSGLTPEAANQLLRYHWPGNVRELENTIERAVVLTLGSSIEPQDLPDEIRGAVMPVYTPGNLRSLEEVERDYILAVLDAVGGNKLKAAETLKIGTSTLFRKLKQYQGASQS